MMGLQTRKVSQLRGDSEKRLISEGKGFVEEFFSRGRRSMTRDTSYDDF